MKISRTILLTGLLTFALACSEKTESGSNKEQTPEVFVLPQNLDDLYQQVFLALKNKDKVLFSNLCKKAVTEKEMDSLANLFSNPEQKKAYENNKQPFLEAQNRSRNMMIERFEKTITEGEQKGIIWQNIGFTSGKVTESRSGKNGAESAELNLFFEHKGSPYIIEISGAIKQMSGGWTLHFLDGIHFTQ